MEYDLTKIDLKAQCYVLSKGSGHKHSDQAPGDLFKGFIENLGWTFRRFSRQRTNSSGVHRCLREAGQAAGTG